jgi:hypothetical protein
MVRYSQYCCFCGLDTSFDIVLVLENRTMDQVHKKYSNIGEMDITSLPDDTIAIQLV